MLSSIEHQASLAIENACLAAETAAAQKALGRENPWSPPKEFFSWRQLAGRGSVQTHPAANPPYPQTYEGDRRGNHAGV